MPGLVEALQALVFCLHELRLEWTVEGTASKPTTTSEPASPSPAPPPASGAAPAPPPPPKRIVTLQQRLLLAKLLEDNRLMGRRRVDSWRLSRSLEEVAHVFNNYCANIRSEAVDGGLEMWRGAELVYTRKYKGQTSYCYYCILLYTTAYYCILLHTTVYCILL